MAATAVASCPCIPDEVFCAWSGCINKLNWRNCILGNLSVKQICRRDFKQRSALFYVTVEMLAKTSVATVLKSNPGLLKWRTAVRIRTFGWWLADLVSLSKVYSIPKSVYPKILRFWPYLWSNSSPNVWVIVNQAVVQLYCSAPSGTCYLYLCYKQVCLKQLIFVQKTNLLKRPPIWGSQIKDKRS